MAASDERRTKPWRASPAQTRRRCLNAGRDPARPTLASPLQRRHSPQHPCKQMLHTSQCSGEEQHRHDAQGDTLIVVMASMYFHAALIGLSSFRRRRPDLSKMLAAPQCSTRRPTRMGLIHPAASAQIGVESGSPAPIAPGSPWQAGRRAHFGLRLNRQMAACGWLRARACRCRAKSANSAPDSVALGS